MMRRPRRPSRFGWLPALALAWAGLIAASSSTVILRREWFAWINRHILGDEESIRRFALFWGASWFVIVKGWHAAEFAILFWLVRSALERATRWGPRRRLAWAVAAAVAFAASDEYHQAYVPGRGGTVQDVAIDSLGIGLAALAWEIRRARGPRQP